MTIEATIIRALAGSVMIATLSACGGGGGGGGGGGTATPAPTNPISVQGTVTGLKGRGFTLQNNAVTLPVSADGQFTFADLGLGAPFHVTVAAQPLAPSQTCVVANGSGTVATPAVTSIAINCVDDELAVLAGRIGGRGARDDEGAFARLNGPLAATVDANGTIYVVDLFSVRKISPLGAVETLAGALAPGNVDALGSAARFGQPFGIAVDGAGNLFVADTANHSIRRVTPNGAVTTFAGNAAVSGGADGTGSGASFAEPRGVSIDGAGNVYVADQANHTVRKITAGAVVTTLAGAAGQLGSSDGVGTAARFNSPRAVAVDSAGNVYVADGGNHTVRKIAASDGEVTTLAGRAGEPGGTNGAAAVARFSSPHSLTLGADGTLYVGDAESGGRVRAVTPAGNVTTIASAGLPGVDSRSGTPGFGGIIGLAAAPNGTLIVADWTNGTVRKMAGSVVTTLAGAIAQFGGTDGDPWLARFTSPNGIVAAGDGTMFAADRGKIRTITPAGIVSTLTGSTELGVVDGPAGQARFDGTSGIALGPNGMLYVTDSINHVVRAVAPDGSVTTLAGQKGEAGYVDGAGSAARFAFLSGIAVDPSGNIYVSEHNRRVVRKITPAGVVSLFAGMPDSQDCCADGTGSNARFSLPHGLATDSSGFVYVTDSGRATIRRISPAGEVTTLAGGNPDGISDGAGTAAGFRFPIAIAVDAANNAYVVDASRIRKITPAGLVTTVAGTMGSSGVRPGPLPGSLNRPTGIAVSSNVPLTLVVTDENSILRVPVRP